MDYIHYKIILIGWRVYKVYVKGDGTHQRSETGVHLYRLNSIPLGVGVGLVVEVVVGECDGDKTDDAGVLFAGAWVME